MHVCVIQEYYVLPDCHTNTSFFCFFSAVLFIHRFSSLFCKLAAVQACFGVVLPHSYCYVVCFIPRLTGLYSVRLCYLQCRLCHLVSLGWLSFQVFLSLPYKHQLFRFVFPFPRIPLSYVRTLVSRFSLESRFLFCVFRSQVRTGFVC